MKAMILAAGVGSRLAPITDHTPKPLVPVLGKPVITRILELLRANGFTQFIANTHYLGDKIQKVYSEEITIRHEETLSGVAGGIRACKDFLQKGNETIAIIMGDALTDIDFSEMLVQHRASGALATMAIKQVPDTSQFGVVCFDDDNRVTSFQEKPKPAEALSNWANTGVYIFESQVLDYIPSEEEAPVYDVAKNLFPDLLKKDIHMNVYKTNAYWADLGTHAQYRQTLFDCLNGVIKVDVEGQKYSWGYLGQDSEMSAGCFVKGKAFIGKNCKLGQSILKGNVVIEDNCVIEDNVVLEDCLVLSGSVIKSGSIVQDKNIAPDKIEEPSTETVYKNVKTDSSLFELFKKASEKVNFFKS
ncbi:MAG: NDP-sugar synthase [Candidatus Caenarcaniphilales bacterium]|nr:NDP-sugar synthase [Candidatus Caenarcaniphilales bacterium]